MENYLSARSLATVQRSLLERRSERRTSCVQPGERLMKGRALVQKIRFVRHPFAS